MSLCIDAHAHVFPRDVSSLAEHGQPGNWEVRACCKGPHDAMLYLDGRKFRAVTNECWDHEDRIAVMDASGIDIQILSPMPGLLSYWLPEARARHIAACVNGALVDMVEAAPHRFRALGMVPLQNPAQAILELKQLMAIPGFVGVEIGSNINGALLGSTGHLDFFAAAADLGALVFIHAIRPVGAAAMADFPGMVGLVGFPCELALAATSLIYQNVATRFPALKLLFSHGGGALASILPRFDQAREVLADVRECVLSPATAQARSFYYDSLVFDDFTLNNLVTTFGASQICIGTDRPFDLCEADPVARIDRLPIGNKEKADIKGQTLARLIGPSMSLDVRRA